MNSLTPEQKKASELITRAVDKQLNEEERVFFEQTCAQDAIIRKLYQEHLLVKNLLKKLASPVQLPQDAKQRFIERAVMEVETQNELVQQSAKRPRSPINTFASYFLAIAAIFIFAWTGYTYLNKPISTEQSFEYYVSETFVNAGGSYLEPDWTFQDHETAELAISEHYNYKVHVPTIKGATFIGVVDVENQNGLHIPILQYHQKDINEFIYLFAFEMHDQLPMTSLRLEEAVKSCQQSTDYHVSAMREGKHVVSWKWDNTWYSAVSNHNGNDLAALVGPLNP